MAIEGDPSASSPCHALLERAGDHAGAASPGHAGSAPSPRHKTCYTSPARATLPPSAEALHALDLVTPAAAATALALPCICPGAPARDRGRDRDAHRAPVAPRPGLARRLFDLRLDRP